MLSDTLHATSPARQALPCVTVECPGASGSLDPWSDARFLPSTTLVGSRGLCTSMHLPARIPYPDQQALPLRTSPAVTSTVDSWSEMLGLVHSKLHERGYPNTSTSHPAGYFRSTGRQCVSGLRWLFLNPPVANRVSELLAPTTNLLWRGYAVAAARCLPIPIAMGQLPAQGASHQGAVRRRNYAPSCVCACR